MNEITDFEHRNLSLSPTHITYRLYGSIPQAELMRRRKERDRQLQQLREVVHSLGNGLDNYHDQQLDNIERDYQLTLDDYLHEASNGPYHLADPAIAREVISSWKHLHEINAVYVYVVCVMSNHVHLVARAPDDCVSISIGELMGRHKRYTAGVCNKLLDRTGLPFWTRDYYDREIRQNQFMRVMWYVLNNPWQAELTESWEEFRHIWLNPEFDELFRTNNG